MEHVEDLKKLLFEPSKIVVTMHEKPDGDAIGSSMGLALFLEKFGHKVSVIAPTDYADFLKWLPGNDRVLNYERASEKCDRLAEEADVLFCCDFNEVRRVGKFTNALANASGKKVMIDHHLKPTDFTDISFSDQKASSTAEIVFDLIEAMGELDKLDYDIAVNLYSGIFTDTGSFQFSATTPRVHRIVAALLEQGVRPELVKANIFDSFSKDRLQLFGYCITEKLKFIEGNDVAFIAVTKDEIRRFNVRTGDMEGLVNYPLKISSVKISALFKEHDGIIKISFRSKGDVDVNSLAREHFNGGGHKNAAGGSSTDDLESTVKRFIGIFGA